MSIRSHNPRLELSSAKNDYYATTAHMPTRLIKKIHEQIETRKIKVQLVIDIC